MKLIADAGGTNTHWRVIHHDGSIEQLETAGLNLMHKTVEDYLHEIESDLLAYKEARQIHFYVAGLLDQPSHVFNFERSLQEFFRNAKIYLQNDLLAAARSMCGHQKGWVGILGTGANVAHYDGQIVDRPVPPLGYLLGDEGSGADLGKQLIKAYLRSELPAELSNKFFQKYKLDEGEMLKKVYQVDNPKTFMSSLAIFIKEEISDPYLYELVYHSFRQHFKVFLKTKSDELPIHYVGSVAHHFDNVLRQVAVDEGLSIGHIAERPIAGLALYHKNS